jgi:hypothetical protein
VVAGQHDVATGDVTAILDRGHEPVRGDDPVWAPDGQMISYWVPQEGNHVAKLIDDETVCDVTLGEQARQARWAQGNAHMPVGCHASSADLLTVPPTGDAALLAFYKPEMHYDSQEPYFADDAREATANGGYRNGVGYGNRLVRQIDEDNEIQLATTNPDDTSSPTLTFGALNATGYPWSALPGWPDTDVPDETDAIDFAPDHEDDAYQLHSDPDLANRYYGHVVMDSEGRKWLQYWFFYYYDEFPFLGYGNHEGDWEGVQVRLDANDRPDLVVMNAHTVAYACTPEEYRSLPNGAPEVFVAYGSHASYAAPGTWNTDVPTHDDHAWGDGPVVRPELHILDANDEWVAWPGRWGGSDDLADPPVAGPQGSSPTGPAFKSAWQDQAAWADDAGACLESRDEWGPSRTWDPWYVGGGDSRAHRVRPVLRIHAKRTASGRIAVDYVVRGLKRPRGGWPKLLLSVRPSSAAPARTRTIVPPGTTSRARHRGHVVLPRAWQGRVVASVLAPDGTRTKSRHVRVR